MPFTFYGHACIKASDVPDPGLLMDPWFAEKGAFLGSWHQFPDNSHLREAALRNATDICISHGHEDHFDPETLRVALAGDTQRLHIARFATDWLLRRMRTRFPDIASRVQEHRPYEPFQAGEGLSVFFVPEDSPGYVDAAIVCTSADGTLVNLNDARLTAAQIDLLKTTVGHVDFLALQVSGASEYPISYTYAEDDMRARRLEKRRQKFQHCERVIDALQPDRILFCAGPPAFLAPELTDYNTESDDSVFPDQLAVLRAFAEKRTDFLDRTLFLTPGDTFSDSYLWNTTNLDDARCFPFTRKPEYLAPTQPAGQPSKPNP